METLHEFYYERFMTEKIIISYNKISTFSFKEYSTNGIHLTASSFCFYDVAKMSVSKPLYKSNLV